MFLRSKKIIRKLFPLLVILSLFHVPFKRFCKRNIHTFTVLQPKYENNSAIAFGKCGVLRVNRQNKNASWFLDLKAFSYLWGFS